MAMNFFLNKYSDDTCTAHDSPAWHEFGKVQLKKLFRFLNFSISDDNLQLLVSRFSYCEKPKGTLLFKANEINTDIYFLIKGSVKIYYQYEAYQQIVSLIAPGGFIASVNSFLYQSPGSVFIETCENTRLLHIQKENFLSEQYISPQAYMHMISILMKGAIEYQTLITDLLYLKSEEKIEFLYNHFPNLFSDFGLKDISSLIGMEPETISRTRKKLSNKKLVTNN